LAGPTRQDGSKIASSQQCWTAHGFQPRRH